MKPKERADAPVAAHPHRRYPIDVASELLDQSRAKTYLDIRAGKLAVIKDGRRTYVPGSEIIRRSTLPAA
jgi:hypothetical protein